MLRVLGNPRRFCDGVTRREAMTAGALSALGSGFSLPNLLAATARNHSFGHRDVGACVDHGLPPARDAVPAHDRQFGTRGDQQRRTVWCEFGNDVHGAKQCRFAHIGPAQFRFSGHGVFRG